jgi:stage V sporulation protein B
MVEKQSTAKGFTILGAAGIINKVLAVLYVPILTLLIGDTGNGIYNAGYNIYLLVFVITNMGIPVAISKLVSEQVALGNYEDSHRTLKISAFMMVIIGLVMTVLTAVFADWLSHQVGRPEAYLTILALSPTMFFTAVSSTFRGYFQGRSNMTPTGMSQVIEQLINSVFTILFAWMMLQYGLHYAASHGIVDGEMVQLTSLKFAAAGATVGTSVGALGSALYLVIVYLRNKRSILWEIGEEKKRKKGSRR